jgi:CheY-like chemotaxis protein
MMLSSEDQTDSIRKCREAGVVRHLVKPVRQADLRRAILEVLEARERRQPGRTSEKPAAGTRTVPLRILLVEDNLVNQRLALRLLEKRGHVVILARHGKEAVEEFKKRPFDLILMDIQMPEMDGFEATAEIRALEAQHGGRIPIMAMTAHAMQGDRERCLAAGMDGYVSKPVRPEDLFRQIERLAPAAARGATQRPRPLVEDPALVRELIRLFLSDLPGQLQALEEAVTREDAGQVTEAALLIKGAVSTIKLACATEAAEFLGRLAGERGLENAGESMACLKLRISELREVLESLGDRALKPVERPESV